jgi:hypothetical protein
MQNLQRLCLVVMLLLAGIGWSVLSYLDGMRAPAEHLAVQRSAPADAPGSIRDGATVAEPAEAPHVRRLVLSVDPTIPQLVSLRQ